MTAVPILLIPVFTPVSCLLVLAPSLTRPAFFSFFPVVKASHKAVSVALEG